MAVSRRGKGSDGGIVMLDPGKIVPSPFTDRMEDPHSSSIIDTLVESIARNGQKIPIVVRPHLDDYTCVYGHRRLAAARKLGISVRALIYDISLEEAAVEQGLENTQRIGLTYVERANFAASLDQMKLPRDVIVDALSTDKTEISRMLRLTNKVHQYIRRDIGPAPKVGRPRWMDLTELMAREGKSGREVLRRIRIAMNDKGFAEADTNQRFALVLAAARAEAKSGAPVRTKSGSEELARIDEAAGVTTFRFARKQGAFAKYVASQLTILHTDYLAFLSTS